MKPSAEDGWFVTPRILDDGPIDTLVASLQPILDADPGQGGVRNLLDESPAVRSLAQSPALRSVAEGVLGAGCFVVRALLFVISGTHRRGRLSAPDIERLRADRAESVCVAKRGEVLAFHPLLLHASSPAVAPVHRRVIHFEFANSLIRTLPGNIAWRWVV